MIIRGVLSKEKLLNIYDTCNKIFNNSDCFYTEQELKEKKQDKKNIFIKRN